jgi:hypothetical protein
MGFVWTGAAGAGWPPAKASCGCKQQTAEYCLHSSGIVFKVHEAVRLPTCKER